MLTDLLLTTDEENDLIYHSRKLICKLRSVYEKDNSWIFYKEFKQKSMTDDEKYAYQMSFLISSLLAE